MNLEEFINEIYEVTEDFEASISFFMNKHGGFMFGKIENLSPSADEVLKSCRLIADFYHRDMENKMTTHNVIANAYDFMNDNFKNIILDVDAFWDIDNNYKLPGSIKLGKYDIESCEIIKEDPFLIKAHLKRKN